MASLLTPRAIRRCLSQPVALDPYLCNVAARVPSHRFLGGATQGCYLRQVALLRAWAQAQGRRPESLSVLDWGTGKGHISYLLQRAGFRVTGCDLARQANDSTFGQATPILAEQQLAVTPLTHDWALPFADRSFDVVVSFGVLEHVANDLASLREIRRVLAPGGAFFFTFLPYWLSWTQRLTHLRGNRYHDRLYRTGDVRRLAAAAGLAVEGVWHGQLFPKNSQPHRTLVERVDRFLTGHTPLRYLATNLEGILRVADNAPVARPPGVGGGPAPG